ncbi:MAG: DUF1045 domain-containing protein, partial [Pseudolabrys sp.]|nr:DUF1045 domain-containing protein [Pseudolabrys sp.]
ASVLGYDCYSAADIPRLDGTDTAEWRDWTQAPRVYGFHGTLKAPFYLATGEDEAALRCALDVFARTQPLFNVGELLIREIGSFIAMVPKERSPALEALAQNCVEAFERFRAPLTEHDRQRRQPERLSERQREYLERWGYPYVLEEFRFHMTLTGSLDEASRQRALSSLRHMCPTDAPKLLVDRIALFRQGENSARFQVLQSVRLAPTS